MYKSQRNQSAMKLHRQAGITLVEIGVSLAILAAVVAGSLALYGSTSTSQKVQQLNQDLISMRGGVQQLYVQSSTYTEGTAGDINVMIQDSKRFPTTLTPDGVNGFTHLLNGNLTIEGEDEIFSIAVSGLNDDACILLATQAADWYSVNNDGTKPTAPDDATARAPATRSALCGAGNAANTLYFYSS
ncbi:type II secretion system protein [Marinobacterium sp. BA1]|uniref:type II secretion system protein n=1 Tax=Marinobacterium sp. BA1 TaxID=3138931 RepID=UPI0032E6EC88